MRPSLLAPTRRLAASTATMPATDQMILDLLNLGLSLLVHALTALARTA